VQGLPLPVSKGSGGNRNPPAGPGSARRFWFFWRSKEQNRKVKKFAYIKILPKEPKKLYNGKLCFPKNLTIASGYRNSSAKRSFAQKFFAPLSFKKAAGFGQRPRSFSKLPRKARGFCFVK